MFMAPHLTFKKCPRKRRNANDFDRTVIDLRIKRADMKVVWKWLIKQKTFRRK